MRDDTKTNMIGLNSVSHQSNFIRKYIHLGNVDLCRALRTFARVLSPNRWILAGKKQAQSLFDGGFAPKARPSVFVQIIFDRRAFVQHQSQA